MPVGFLNKTLQAQLSSFPETINYNDLITYFTMTDQDLRAVPARSSAINRLGFAVQLCALRFMGFFIKNMNAVPEIIIEFLKKQLSLNQTLDIRYYAERRQTRSDHIKAIEKHLSKSTPMS
ncbi:MAG: DUF4158 domain-containing protein [Desulfobacteraceae bacterium]|jgi:TnpA family transposase